MTLENLSAHPPSYAGRNGADVPVYTAYLQSNEHLIAANHLRKRILTSYVKQGKGGVTLSLQGQQSATLPVYGLGSKIEGFVNVVKTEGVTSVEVTLEGSLRLHELAESGAKVENVCFQRVTLWKPSDGAIPESMPFTLTLPTSFESGNNGTYSLPPSFESHLRGLPGFDSFVAYKVKAIANKPHVAPGFMKSHFGGQVGPPTASTKIIYRPRTRPGYPIPNPLENSWQGDTTGWKMHESCVSANVGSVAPVKTELYLPASRIFYPKEPIPFHLVFKSPTHSLATFMAFAPMPGGNHVKSCTRIVLRRQVAVDVHNNFRQVEGTSTEIWKIDTIGRGTFREHKSGPNWVSYHGEIVIDTEVPVSGFKAGGLLVRDCIVLSMDPPDLKKSPFSELRLVVPIRLTTDPYTTDGTGVGVLNGGRPASGFSVPSDPEPPQDLDNGRWSQRDEVSAPTLHYG